MCRLCGSGKPALICEGKRRPFYLCGNCELISVPPKYWLSVDGERARYDLHDNSMSNGGYVEFLSQMADTVTAVYHPGMKILDFGSGKEAVLCRLIKAKGIDCRAYDPLYGRQLPDDGTISPSEQYGVIILCEVVEHLRDIGGELALIRKLLRDGGIIVIRTQIYGDPSVFPNWWYAQDPTHINFFNQASLKTMAAMMGKQIVSAGYPDIFILQ